VELSAANFLPGYYFNQVQGTLIALPVLLGVHTMVLAFLAWQLYKEFGWKIYKQIGADPKMKRRYLVYQIYIALLKFDFFLFVGFAVQFLVIVQGTATYETVLTSIALPIVIILLLLAGFSAQRENVIGTAVSLFFYAVAMAYFIFKLVRIYDSGGDRALQYRPAKRTLTTFAVMTIILLTVTIAVCIWTWTNYGRGLIEHTHKKHRPQPPPKEDLFMDSYSASRPTNNDTAAPQFDRRPQGSRMEID